MEIQYDKFGRMKYHPAFHQNHFKRWNEEDLQYLKDWYYKIGPEEMSFALDRPIVAVMNKVAKLKKKGEIREPIIRSSFKRMQA